MKRQLPNYYTFPAIFSFDYENRVSVIFPDLPGCEIVGKTEQEALVLAKEELGIYLLKMEQDGKAIPSPSSILSFILGKREASTLVEVFMPGIRQANEQKTTSRTINLPKWLSTLAAEQKMNLSETLQSVLINQLVHPENK